MRASTENIKQAAHQLLDKLPETATWDDVAYHIEVRASIERGLADSAAGRVYTTEEVYKHFNLDE